MAWDPRDPNCDSIEQGEPEIRIPRTQLPTCRDNKRKCSCSCGRYCKSFNGKLRDELLAREFFYTLREAKVLIDGWRRHYNYERPHSSLGYGPPASGGGAGRGRC